MTRLQALKAERLDTIQLQRLIPKARTLDELFANIELDAQLSKTVRTLDRRIAEEQEAQRQRHHLNAELKKAQREWEQSQSAPEPTPEPLKPRMWMHPTEHVDVTPPVPITEGHPKRDLAPHLIATELEQRASQLVSHHYATMGRKRSRRYEGFR